MTPAPKTRLSKLAAATLAAAIAFPAIAGAVVLPQNGPVPTARPTLEAPVVAVTVPARAVIQISTSVQELPEERRNVRVVGANFLPDASEEIDFASSHEQQTAAAGYAEWLVMTAVTRMFERGDGTDPLLVASN